MVILQKRILNMIDVRKIRVEDFGQNQLVSKEIPVHAPIKKSNYKYTLSKCPAEIDPSGFPVNKFAELPSPVPSYASPANK